MIVGTLIEFLPPAEESGWLAIALTDTLPTLRARRGPVG